MPGRHYSESTPRFPFQDDDISEDELARPLALMNFIPRGSRAGLERNMQQSNVRTDNGWSDDDYDHDDGDSASESEVVSTHTGPYRQVNGPTQPMLVSRVTNAPLSRSDLYQRTTETLAEIAARLLETERILGRSVSISVPVSVPTSRPIHSSGQPRVSSRFRIPTNRRIGQPITNIFSGRAAARSQPSPTICRRFIASRRPCSDRS